MGLAIRRLGRIRRLKLCQQRIQVALELVLCRLQVCLVGRFGCQRQVCLAEQPQRQG